MCQILSIYIDVMLQFKRKHIQQYNVNFIFNIEVNVI